MIDVLRYFRPNRGQRRFVRFRRVSVKYRNLQSEKRDWIISFLVSFHFLKPPLGHNRRSPHHRVRIDYTTRGPRIRRSIRGLIGLRSSWG